MNRKVRCVGMLAIALLFISTAICSAAIQPAAQANSSWNSQIRIGAMVGSGGAATDFFTEFFIPLWANQKSLFYFNPHFRLDDNDGNEMNVGFGGRTLIANDKLILGLNAFYDRMKSEHDEEYNQFGIGVEALSKWLDFRANYYQPFGTTERFVPALNEYKFGSTSLLQYRGVEEALKGVDIEAGVLVPFISDFLETRISGGYFWYFSDYTDDIDGWKARVELKPNKLLTLMAEASHDNLRGDNQFYGGYLDIPFSLEELFKGRNPFVGIKDALALGKGARSVPERMTERVVRDRHITAPVFTSKKKPVKAPGINEMIYVDGDNATAGTGTLQDPYQTIGQALADDRYNAGTWVYVFDANPYNENNLAMESNTVLWGQGYRHPVFRLGGGTKPIIDGGTSDIIILNGVNEVMGLQIQNGNYGLVNSPDGGATLNNVTRASIHDNIIQGNLRDAIYIDNTGAAAFTGANVVQNLAFNISDNQILDNGGYGAYIANNLIGDASVTGSIANTFAGNTITGNGDDGVYIYSYVEAPSIQVPIVNRFTGNTINDNNGYGVELEQ